MTSLVFRNFYFNYYSYRFGLGFRLGFGLGLGLGFGLGLGLRVSFFSLYYKMSARTERAPSLFLVCNRPTVLNTIITNSKADNKAMPLLLLSTVSCTVRRSLVRQGSVLLL